MGKRNSKKKNINYCNLHPKKSPQKKFFIQQQILSEKKILDYIGTKIPGRKKNVCMFMHFFSLVFTFLLLEEEWQRRLEKKLSIMNKKGSQVSTPVRTEQSKAKQSRTMLKFELLMFESRNRLTLTYPAYAPTSWVIVHTQHMRPPVG
jgi:hypothetical protein